MLADAIVGFSTIVNRSGGPPADTMARLIRRSPKAHTFLAPGWGLNTTEFPAAMMLMALLRMVGTGCVDGVTEAMTP